MNPIRRWRLKNRLRVAARLHAAGDLTDPYYAALAAHVLFELAGRVLKAGDTVSRVDFERAVARALRLPTAYQWDAPHLRAKYGPYHQALIYLAPGTYDTATGAVQKNATGDYAWGAQAQGLYAATVPLVAPLRRFETRVAKLKNDYPTLTGAGAWFASLIVAGLIGAWIARAFTASEVVK
jgi:hypothetical protein